MADNQSVFERYGGFTSVSRIVSAFYDKVLESPIVAGYFEGSDMRRLVDHQTKFIATLLGGPTSYNDEALARMHAHLDIDQESFDEVVELLTETLEDFDVAPEDVESVRQAFNKRRDLIVTRSGGG